jgi:TM2 domain-containing membrane protein YozV/cold shock CspA family protein
MRGQVLAFDFRTGLGEISADDGNRYKFVGTEWKPDRQPNAGQVVDFETATDEARAIYLVPNPISASPSNSTPDRFVAGLLALFLGTLGIHKFYTGRNKAGLIMLLVSVFGAILLLIPTIVMGTVAFCEAIIYLTMSDERFQLTYIQDRKNWF